MRIVLLSMKISKSTQKNCFCLQFQVILMNTPIIPSLQEMNKSVEKASFDPEQYLQNIRFDIASMKQGNEILEKAKIASLDLSKLIKKKLQNRHPIWDQALKMKRQSQCSQDANIKYVTFGNTNSTVRALVTCNVHARELVTAEVCLAFINQTVRQNSHLLKLIQFTVFYMPNPLRQRVIDGEYFLRTDENNNDLNRNFPYKFTQTQGQTFGERVALSERYSQCLDQLALQLKPTIYLDIHTGQYTLGYQQNSDQSIQDASLTILQQLKVTSCKNCRIVNVEGLNINEQAFEYLKYHYGVKYSNLMEIYGGYSASQAEKDRCFTIFNPLTQRQLDFYTQRAISTMNNYFMLILQKEDND